MIQSTLKRLTHPITFVLWMLVIQSTYAQCDLMVSTSGENTDFVQVLILADTDGTIIQVINSNSGTVMIPNIGSYNVHALNYDPANPPDPLPEIGGTIAGVGSFSGCFNDDNFGSDIKPIECLCEAETITASFFAQSGYTIIYALADANGLILATNTTGIFDVADGLADDTFIHALHYEIDNPPSPLPSTGLNVSEVGTIALGCFNQEFVSNPLYILVSPNPAPQEIEIVRVCAGNAIFASIDGVDPIEANGLTFTWHLNGVIIAVIDNSPYFSPTMPGNYTVSIEGNEDCSSYFGDTPFPVIEIIDCTNCN